MGPPIEPGLDRPDPWLPSAGRVMSIAASAAAAGASDGLDLEAPLGECLVGNSHLTTVPCAFMLETTEQDERG